MGTVYNQPAISEVRAYAYPLNWVGIAWPEADGFFITSPHFEGSQSSLDMTIQAAHSLHQQLGAILDEYPEDILAELLAEHDPPLVTRPHDWPPLPRRKYRTGDMVKVSPTPEDGVDYGTIVAWVDTEHGVAYMVNVGNVFAERYQFLYAESDLTPPPPDYLGGRDLRLQHRSGGQEPPF